MSLQLFDMLFNYERYYRQKSIKYNKNVNNDILKIRLALFYN